MLDPRPRDFTAAPALDSATILDALRNGRPETAMRSFSSLISETEMEDVTRFITEAFVGCGKHNTAYHTPENGWPDHHARYGPAVPFAMGEIALDAPADMLDAAELQGRELFLSACVSCHEGRVARPTPLGVIAAGAGAPPPTAPTPEEPHQDDYETPTVHDFAPPLDNPTPAEQRGKSAYTRACAQCHAADGTGMNWVGSFLQPNPTDFTMPAFAASFDRAAFASKTLDAPTGTSMPSFRGVLTEAEAADIAAYVERVFVRKE